MWTLTTTVRPVRDHATSALYQFGCLDPGGLFELTVDALSINDVYVPERMAAAAYGLAMGHQQTNDTFLSEFAPYLNALVAAFLGETAKHPTLHWLLRMYVRETIAFGKHHFPDCVPIAVRDSDPTFAGPPAVESLALPDPRAVEADRTLHSDFENYTLGRLFNERSNYDMKHAGHRAAVAHVLGTVWACGWRADRFGDIDKSIAEDRYRQRADRPAAERYGKKYGWIGFFTYAGLLEDRGRLPYDDLRLSDVDIDPSFPVPPPRDPTDWSATEWLSSRVSSDEVWIREGEISFPRHMLRRERIGEREGPWILAYAHLVALDRILGRRVSSAIAALLLQPDDQQRLSEVLTTGDPGVSTWGLLNPPSDHYTFAGEIPWSDHYAADDPGDGSLYRESVDSNSGRPIEVEGLAHNYAWESYHSTINEAGGSFVPSRLFSSTFGVRSSRQTFDQALPDGSLASVTLSAPDGFDGHLLYLREDLIQMYSERRAIVWYSWAERQPYPFPHRPPEWLDAVLRRRGNQVRLVLTATDLGLRW